MFSLDSLIIKIRKNKNLIKDLNHFFVSCSDVFICDGGIEFLISLSYIDLISNDN